MVDFFQNFLYEVWVMVFVAACTLLLYIVKTRLNKLDKLAELFVPRIEHEKDLTTLEEKMITCQEQLKLQMENQKTEMNYIKEGVQENKRLLGAVHRRIDDIYESKNNA